MSKVNYMHIFHLGFANLQCRDQACDQWAQSSNSIEIPCRKIILDILKLIYNLLLCLSIINGCGMSEFELLVDTSHKIWQNLQDSKLHCSVQTFYQTVTL